jgi:hypothetical protein
MNCVLQMVHVTAYNLIAGVYLNIHDVEALSLSVNQ